jgi:hypothetical protein
MEECSKCKYFKTKQGPGKKGACHRYPPAMVDKYDMAYFPQVKPTTVCGEFQRDPRLVRVHKPEEKV